MASFDPKECKPGVFNFDANVTISWVRKLGIDCWKSSNDDAIYKLPLKKFEPTLRKFTQVAIPTDLDRLKRHHANMEKHLATSSWTQLNIEQTNASRTVQQLRATVRDLENTRQQIQDSDLKEFDSRVAKVKKEVAESIQSFGNLELDLLKRIRQSNIRGGGHSADAGNSSGGSLVADVTQGAAQDLSSMHLQLQQQEYTYNTEDAALAAASWNELRESLVELNGMIHEFSSLVHQQQEQIDSITDNVDKTHSNVRQATIHLAQANKYKAAILPVAGAVVGGLVGGPIGLLAGFKLAGVATAVGGSFVGWQGAKFIKRRRDQQIDVELSKLSNNRLEDNASKLKHA